MVKMSIIRRRPASSSQCFLLSAFVLLICIEALQGDHNVTRIFKREILDGSLQDYLTNFGYMPQSADGAFALRTEDSVRKAIKDMQKFAGIPVTGKADERTLKLIRTPRCGLPDHDNWNNGRKKRYAIHGYKWPYTDLTWSLRTTQFQDLDTYEVRYVLSKALSVWSKHSKLTFTEVDSDEADILIYFYRREHGDNFAFDGKGVILAHAFFPTGTRSSVDVHFDADESWTTSGDSEQGTNLFNVAAHEFGHSLGLAHSNVEGALMYPWYSEMKDGWNYELPNDDRLAIQSLYGPRHQPWGKIPQNPTHIRPSTTSTTTTTTTTTHRPNIPKYPYDPRYPMGRVPAYKPEKYPHKPDKKPYKPDHKPHHKHPHYPSYSTPSPPPTRPTRKYHHHHTTTTERTTSYSSKEYSYEDEIPDTCDTSYDAVAVIRRELFIFKNKYFWRIGDNGLVTTGYPAEISRLFRGFPRNLTHVDAVFERADGNIIFFVDNLYYVFAGVTLEPGFPKPISHLGLPRSLRKIDGAMIWGHNGKTFLFSGRDYWRFDDDKQEVEKDYPRKIARVWRGVEDDIDAVFQWKDGRTYFFKGKGFWKFNDGDMQVYHRQQKLSAPVWMGCRQNYEQNDLNQKLPYTVATGGSRRRSSHILLLLLTIILSTTTM